MLEFFSDFFHVYVLGKILARLLEPGVRTVYQNFMGQLIKKFEKSLIFESIFKYFEKVENTFF